jgi:hypothetical protein
VSDAVLLGLRLKVDFGSSAIQGGGTSGKQSDGRPGSRWRKKVVSAPTRPQSYLY